MTVDGTESPARERTRTAILRAAITVLAGCPGAALGDVARAAGVARSTLHRYYPDRAALDTAVETFVDAEYDEALQRARPADGTGLEAYTRICGELLDRQDVFGWWLRPTATYEDDGVAEQERPVVDVVRRGHLDGSIDAALDAGWLVNHIWACLFTAFHLPGSGRRSAREAREMCLHTLVKSAAATPR